MSRRQLDKSRCGRGERSGSVEQDQIPDHRRRRSHHHCPKPFGNLRHCVRDESGAGTCNHQRKNRLTLGGDHGQGRLPAECAKLLVQQPTG